MVADVAWWFSWNVSEIEEMTLDELSTWLEQANRQIKAGYSKATL
ncbi:GpE family phage tail protein [Pasteurella multocida]|nr:GpE family phage tail protein [Pasteurella multocida]MDX3889756.1 GpE family phage tail protein [Pasteurella multocida]MDX3891565.1 GpE family phage tail protein [Pasteurella multocida]MDX3951707.1 GpE family phage tail protein [Pasteurella multocida]MDX3954118.1 GpE family phage tail protein [Pasteurella multocida]MDX3961868.1 GpE family phage tail protein [Pasteurella multocida]